MMTPAERKELDDLKKQVADLRAGLALATAYAGVDLTVSEPDPPAGQLLAFPAGRRSTRKRVAGSAASRLTPSAAPRHASTLGTAS